MTRMVGCQLSGPDGFATRNVDEPAVRELSQADYSFEVYDSKPGWQWI